LNPQFCYLMMRTDLPSLGRGKALAHAHHAGCHLTWTLVVEPLLAGEKPAEHIMEWHRSGGGFGVCAAIGGPGEMPLDVLSKVVHAAKRFGHHSGLVIDHEYPMFVDEETMTILDRNVLTTEPKRVRGGWIITRRETTGGWILGDKQDQETILKRFDLVPNEQVVDAKAR
jgi:hypothetical protein